MANYRCEVCHFVYKEDAEGLKWDDLHENWVCPVCNSPKPVFILLEEKVETKGSEKTEQTISQPAGDGEGRLRTISDVMIETMVNWGVTHVFGMVGHSNLGLSEAIRRQCEASRLSFIGIRHEGAASFAASA